MSRSIAIALSRWSGYSWLVAALAMLVVLTSNAMTNAGLTVFDESLLNELGCSVAQLKVRDSITFLATSLLVLLAGWLVDRYGFKPFLLIGLTLLGVSYLLYSQAQSLAQLYLLHLLFAVVLALAGITVSVITAATWMPRRRGLAIGLTVAGTSIGGILIPPLANALNTRFGWRSAMRMEAVWPLLLVVVLMVALRNRPKRDGSETDAAAAATKAGEGMTFSDVLRRRQFFQVAFAGSLTFFAVLSLFSHLFLFMRSHGFDPATASLGLSLFSLAGLAGKLGSGWISDRVDAYRLLRVQMFTMLAGLVGITLVPSFIWIFLIVTGLGWGSLHTLFNYILITLFGLRDAGKINGTVSIVNAAGGGLGILLTGLAHDALGGYPEAFGIVCAVMFLGALLTLRLRPPRETAAAT
ncbi:MAG: MFS transporter [Thermoanaerobaculales bacterium]|jgi:predicted MFS family arabinose efflux permease|nr:MFS transporter [Thermoanaerobaculales bacterium]